MAEHGTSGVSAVFAPHPDRLFGMCVLTCGRFLVFSPPPCVDLQGDIEAWFEARRDLRQDWPEARDG